MRRDVSQNREPRSQARAWSGCCYLQECSGPRCGCTVEPFVVLGRMESTGLIASGLISWMGRFYHLVDRSLQNKQAPCLQTLSPVPRPERWRTQMNHGHIISGSKYHCSKKFLHSLTSCYQRSSPLCRNGKKTKPNQKTPKPKEAALKGPREREMTAAGMLNRHGHSLKTPLSLYGK